MPRPGRDFELAVFEFIRTVDPAAEVRFDHRVPDRDTGTPRQVDAWATLRVLGNIPLSVLISCKDHERPLDIGEIDTFVGELFATSASAGVIYSRSGFTTNAVEKARKGHISCCRLFDDAPPDKPSELLFEAMSASPVYTLFVQHQNAESLHELRWSALPALQFENAGRKKYDAALAEHCQSLFLQSEAARGHSGQPGPADIQSVLEVRESVVCPAFIVHTSITWDWFRGTLDAIRLRGSLNATEHSFVGSARVGPIRLGSNFGGLPWVKSQRPSTGSPVGRLLLSIMSWPTAEDVQRLMSNDPVFGGGPWQFGPALNRTSFEASTLDRLLASPPSPVLNVDLTFKSP